jgi:hypothetical protein
MGRRPPNGVNTRAIHGTFGTVICPLLAKWLGGGRLFPVEKLEDPPGRLLCGIPEHFDALSTCEILDLGAHIDYLYQGTDRSLRGIAARAQEWRPDWASRWPFDTFTLRQRPRNAGAEVEADHIRRALARLDEGVMFPGLTVQAYLHNGCLDSLGMVRTADLYRTVDCPPVGFKLPSPQPVQGGNWMQAVPWAELERFGVPIWRLQR